MIVAEEFVEPFITLHHPSYIHNRYFILLLYGRIDEGCLIGISLAASIVLVVLLVLLVLLPILQNKVDADTFFQDKALCPSLRYDV